MTMHYQFGTRDTAVDRHLSGLVAHPTIGHVLYLNQTHSARVIVVTEINDAVEINADAAITTVPHLALAVKTADCAPILLHAPQTNMIAAIHSGWRGTLQDIVTATVTAMRNLGANPQQIQAWIGPCLQQHNFQVGDDVYQEFCRVDLAYNRFFIPDTTPGKYRFDHLGLLRRQLQANGIVQINCDTICTWDQADHYHSHRARHHDPAHETMRNVSLIWLDYNDK